MTRVAKLAELSTMQLFLHTLQDAGRNQILRPFELCERGQVDCSRYVFAGPGIRRADRFIRYSIGHGSAELILVGHAVGMAVGVN